MLFIFGCASMQGAYDDYGYFTSSNGGAAAVAVVKNNVSSFITGVLNMFDPLKGYAGLIGSVVGGFASFIYGMYLGKKKKKG